MTTDGVRAESPESLRAAMVGRLREQGHIRRDEVAAAFAAVPRERFCPEASVAAAYSARDTVRTKADESGRRASSLSAPWRQADLIESARIGPGMRVLEIGSGGYSAAVLAELVGPAGTVVTVDIDPWVTERTSRFLADTGYTEVRVLLGDAEHAVAGHGPFDAILVTAGAWDVPWTGLLAEGGRLVGPLDHTP
ncbi:protein-L-isoaspartate(D-aspartate) O-methyltransferase [Actinocorallia herbida]|uniref:Protein-L-isoaspartate O-methyltransferase n=1 Tax=Actinocorallia herbida TaxID=58109 RepID=A0A3N1CXQ1_9ACTN|nr:methyltransferase domain-containing protein [Actinocorallia herbida]ROO85498.1 protein-L-isoaspartate(D-aspartate) O-methyltransferase [Actinocorallia herbida]